MSEGNRPNTELLRLVYKHDDDLYKGNGKPGITTRLALVESTVDSIKYYARWILVSVLGILVVAILNLVIKR